MADQTEQVTDHKAEALTLLAEADTARLDRHRGHAKQLRAEALVHSNLAIAEGQEAVAVAVTGVQAELQELREGQERVAEALEGRADTWFRQALDQIRGLAIDQGETDDNEVRERIFHIADDALERAQS